MQMKITENDVPDLIGKFIVQIDTTHPDTEICSSWNFYSEKRIKLVTYDINNNLVLQGLYYCNKKFDSKEEFVEYFNNYINGSQKRFHRLLYSDELEYMFKQFQQKQY